ncbi:MAG: hypothetical protein IJ106_06065 [Parasporobacterium sp.]|nr:hypothetical protein [Parasporobacterium sp.]
MDRREEQKKRRKKNLDTHKRVSVFNAIIFFGVILAADVILLFSHGRVFSENENRTLQQAPVLTSSSLTSGKFMKQFESFVADQFFYRDGWIYTKLKMDKVLGRKVSNGVYLGEQGYLFEDAAVPAQQSLDRNLDAINQFSNSHSGIRQVMMIVPNASEVISDLLPSGAPVRSQAEDLTAISSRLGPQLQFVDLLPVLKEHKNEELYYKSDHHWTSLAAMYAFDVVAGEFDLSPSNQYRVLTVTDDFSGTMAATSGDFDVRDRIDLYLTEPEVDYYVEYSGDPVKYSSIYSSSALEQKNKYEVFFGGNFPKITITTVNHFGRNLLLLKDSYANCFVQFLLPYFDRILIIDPRYYSDDLEADIAAAGITDLLILYNENTFVQDNSLSGVLDPQA